MELTFAKARRLGLAGLLSLGLLVPGPPVAADTIAFSGQATVVQATLLQQSPLPPLSVTISDTGPLPAAGGALEASLLSVSLPPGAPASLNAEVAHAATVGQGDRSRAEASVAALSLSVAGQSISADFLMSRAVAQCTGSGPAVSGTSELANLVINGQAITISGAPNQTVNLPAGAGTVVINEQSSSVAGNAGSIDVNALHVIVNNPAGGSALADVVIAHSHADVTCAGAPTCSAPGDFITGGGWIRLPSGAKANFAVAGGIKNGNFWGHLTYIDHGTGLKVKGLGVTAYSVGATPTTRNIDGVANINDTSGTYHVEAADNGEPGVGTDTFKIVLSNGYSAANTLGGGNIQLHKPCVS